MVQTILIGNEIYKEDFEMFEYPVLGTNINSCKDSILDITSTNSTPQILMYGVTSFSPKEHRYIEVKYKATNVTNMEFLMIENSTNETYSAGEEKLVGDANWHTIVFDLWNNKDIKDREEITGWRLDWEKETIGASMQIDYIRII